MRQAASPPGTGSWAAGSTGFRDLGGRTGGGEQQQERERERGAEAGIGLGSMMTTGAATTITLTGAIVPGTVDPNGAPTPTTSGTARRCHMA